MIIHTSSKIREAINVAQSASIFLSPDKNGAVTSIDQRCAATLLYTALRVMGVKVSMFSTIYPNSEFLKLFPDIEVLPHSAFPSIKKDITFELGPIHREMYLGEVLDSLHSNFVVPIERFTELPMSMVVLNLLDHYIQESKPLQGWLESMGFTLIYVALLDYTSSFTFPKTTTLNPDPIFCFDLASRLCKKGANIAHANTLMCRFRNGGEFNC